MQRLFDETKQKICKANYSETFIISRFVYRFIDHDYFLNLIIQCNIRFLFSLFRYRIRYIGSGLNILSGSCPPDLAGKAACLEDFGLAEPWDSVLSRYLPLLESAVLELESRGFSGIRRRLEEHCVMIGKPVIVSGGQQAEGIAEGIGTLGELLVRLPSGQLVSVTCGDVSVRGVNGYV